MCGKDEAIHIEPLADEGSPPRVREGLALYPVARINRRITPACAGRTNQKQINIVGARDHPRVCGKDRSRIRFTLELVGSPPRVREGPATGVVAGPALGITPACAGRTVAAPSRRRRSRDHPRVCGKDSLGLTAKALM